MRLFSLDLQKHLAELGLTEAVDKSKADLSNISGKKDLYLANVFHASALEWDTEGNPFDASIYGSWEDQEPQALLCRPSLHFPCERQQDQLHSFYWQASSA